MNATNSKRIERLIEIHDTISAKCASRTIKPAEIDDYSKIILNTSHDSSVDFKSSDPSESKRMLDILNKLIKTIGQNKAVIEAAGPGSFSKLEESLNAGLLHFMNEQELANRSVTRSQKAKGA